jgi:uncharacterized protein (DUF169 family)
MPRFFSFCGRIRMTEREGEKGLAGKIRLAYTLETILLREVKMSAIMPELEIFKKFKFKLKPIGVKFLLYKPKGMRKLDKKLAICEMWREAQKTEPFYATVNEFNCVAPILLGMAEGDPVFESGSIGPELEIFEEPRANRRLYYYLTKLEKNSVNYVAFASIDKITFTPDILLISAEARQLEIIMRAMCYATGKMWTAKGTPVMECSWLMTYPYISGEVNFALADASHGMISKQIFPAGTILISIPFDKISPIAEGLKKIEWEPELYTKGRAYHDKKFEEVTAKLHKKLEKEQ